MSQGAEPSDECKLVQRCLAGEADALSVLHEEYLIPVSNLLVSRGVEPVVARDVIEVLWTDCVVSGEGQAALLEKFNGRSSLRTWLFRVALNRSFDRGRTRSRVNYLTLQPPKADALEEEELVLQDMPAPAEVSEPDLTMLLRESLQAGFDSCPAEDLLKLRLVFLHGLTQREVARLWECHEVTIARDLQRSLHLIADQTLLEARRRDPRLTLSWEDFVELCDAGPMDFF